MPGSVANGSHFSAAFRYDYKPFAIAAGYVKLKDIATSAALGTYAINSPVNSGYATARSAQLFAAAARYTAQDLMVGINYSNVQYAPGHGSLFASEGVFNTYGVISTYRITPAVIVGAGYSYTRASKANGVSDPRAITRFRSNRRTASPRTTLYALGGVSARARRRRSPRRAAARRASSTQWPWSATRRTRRRRRDLRSSSAWSA